MYIKNLVLQNFRNFSQKELRFDRKLTVILGPNASGKTNILEAIYLLSFGKSFKAEKDEEMIKEGKSFAKIAGSIDGKDVKKVSVIITKPEQQTSKTIKKPQVNDVGRRLYDFVGNLKAVLFGPWDLALVVDPPSKRRRFLDFVLTQVDREYRRSLLSYERALRQRNKILENIRNRHASPTQLTFWNQLLIKNGNYLTDMRESFIDFANTRAFINNEEFELEYRRSGISEKRLKDFYEAELALGQTLIGPHRDDFIFKKDGRNLKVYGSRGEQRMAVLWLKLAELEFIRAKTGDMPTILLDDIFSELDAYHQEIIVQIVANQQTIITTTDAEFLGKHKPAFSIIELK